MSLPKGLMPPEVQAFVDELEQRGFSIMDERYEGERHFGNAFVDYQRDGLTIRVVRERLDWYLVIAGPGENRWIPLHVWRAYLDGAMPPGAPMTLQEEIAFVRERLPRLLKIMEDPGPEVLEGLLAWAHRSAQQRGILPTADAT